MTAGSAFDLPLQMNRRELEKLERELREYVEVFVAGMGRRERKAAMRSYVTGLLLDGDRKSVEPMASRLVDSADEVEAMRQRLLDCVGKAAWSDDEVLRRLTIKLDGELPGISALVVDDTGFPKKGRHSVGVMRQYSGTLGRTDNCQVATSLHLAGEGVSGCIGLTLYLPEEWTKDLERCKKAGVPEDLPFRRKWEISLAQIDKALAWGVRKHVVLADAGYGDVGEYRDGLTKRGLRYVVGISGTPVVWSPESKPRILPRRLGSRGPLSNRYRDDAHPPLPIAALATALTYRKVQWREGSRKVAGKGSLRWQSSQFAAVRVRTAHLHLNGHPPGDEQWLLCERPTEGKPPKYWLSSMPASTSLRALVANAKLRWRVERDYQELKQEVGLDHFEGRSWRGFHHHATLCAVAHGFLMVQRALFPPAGHELDSPDGAQSASARAHPHAGLLPTLPSGIRSRLATARSLSAVTDAIE